MYDLKCSGDWSNCRDYVLIDPCTWSFKCSEKIMKNLWNMFCSVFSLCFLFSWIQINYFEKKKLKSKEPFETTREHT